MPPVKRALLLPVLLASCAPELVDVRERIPGAIVDMRYAGPDNFLKQPIYAKDRCLLRPAVAERLASVVGRLAEQGLRLIVWDCYRPLRVQRKMWAMVPDERFVADPDKGSNHNRAAAVDVTLAEPSGRPLPMPTGHDDFTPMARADAPAPEPGRSNRDRLRQVMEAEGFVPLATEWWHFAAPEATTYDVLDQPL
jgi:zinc D-Ala-D-Ala dipeptidase